jgi:Tol biopolymer transport system component
VIGASGGTATEASGASVIVPSGALTADTTIRIARDSTGAPAMAADLAPSGSMYMITPHGGDFAEPIEVRIPAPAVTLQPNQLFKLAKAQPGGEWVVLEDTVLDAGALSVRVNSFSFFMPVIVTYLLPIAQVPPLEMSVELNCGALNCLRAMGTVNASYVVTGNGGALPETCPNAEFRIFSGVTLNFSSTGVSSAMPITAFGGTLSRVLTQSANTGRYTFGVGRRCAGTGTWTAWNAAERRVQWQYQPTYPGIIVLRSPETLDIVEGAEANIEVVFSGGASGSNDSFNSVTDFNRAIIDWERSDNNGQSWRVVARSYENEGNPWVFAAPAPWMYWSVRHLFLGTIADQGALIRTHACFTPRDVPPANCVTGRATRINVLQQSSAPVVVTSPRSMLVRSGQTASLAVTTAGIPAPAVQWQSRPANSTGAWTDLAGVGANTANYTTAALALSDNGLQFRAVATSSIGTANSGIATVSVSDLDVEPSFATQPANLSVTAGSDAVFAVDARGTEALSYQWFRNGIAIAGANGPVHRVAGATLANAGSYTVMVSNAAGNATSSSAVLTVTAGAPAAVAPTIITQPVGVTANAGTTATLAVGVDGTGPFSFQWRRDGANVAGATSAVLTFNTVALPNAGIFSVVVTNSAGSVTSSNAVLDVSAASVPTAPAITSEPSTLIVPYRGSGVVAVGATGSGPLSYQWSKDGAPLTGATLPVLDFNIVAEQDVGTYTVTITNGVGSVTSQAASIILLGAPVITQQPADVTAIEGDNATFFVAASSSGLRYQWSVNGSPIPGAIGATFNTGPTSAANSGAVYSVLVYNGAGHVYSQSAVLTVQVIVAPSVTIQPQNSTIQPGQTAPICAAIGGTAPFTGLMQRWNGADWVLAIDNVVFSDNTELCLATPTLQSGDNGAIFRLRFNNGAGVISTNGATITVQAPATGPVVTDTTLVSRALAGGPPNNLSDQPSISADGRYVAFVSIGTNLVEGTVRNGNAYVRDMQTGVTRLVNVNLAGNESALGVQNAKLSSNGRFVIFTSRSGDLVAGDTNTSVDVFRRDLDSNTTIRLNVMPNGDEAEYGVSGGGNGDMQLDISADGQSVIFLSGYDVTGTESNNGYYYLYHRDVQSGLTRRIAGSSEYGVAYSALSDDGLYIAYAMGVSNSTQSIQLYDVEASSERSVFAFDASVSPAGLRQGMSISSNGRYIAFTIAAPDLLGSPHNQVIVADRNTNTYVVASMNQGVLGNGNSGYPEISGDGRYVMFSSIAPSLTNNLATAFAPLVVVRDLVEQDTLVASLRSNGTEASAGTYVNDQNALSEDGTTLAFVSDYYVMTGQQAGNQVFAAPRP